jgi:hypothetical protein
MRCDIGVGELIAEVVCGIDEDSGSDRARLAADD